MLILDGHCFCVKKGYHMVQFKNQDGVLKMTSDDGMDLVDLPCLGDLGCPLTM